MEKLTLYFDRNFGRSLPESLSALHLNAVHQHTPKSRLAMKVAKEYGERLGKRSKNLQDDALRKLINDYPSHGFVIDRDEAKELFNIVRAPNEVEYELINAFARSALMSPIEDAITFVVSESAKENKDASDNKNNDSENQVPAEPGHQSAAGGGEAVAAPAADNITPITAAAQQAAG